MNPKNTLYDVKRIIGRAWNDGVVQDEKKQFPFKMTESDQVRATRCVVHACLKLKTILHHVETLQH